MPGVVLAGLLLLTGSASAQATDAPSVAAQMTQWVAGPDQAGPVRTAVMLTLLGFIPGVLVSTTAFIRIAVVLSMVRHAFGMPETPPTPVLIVLALLLTAFVMAPTLEQVHVQALQPYLAGTVTTDVALEAAASPLREFMLRQVREDELRAMYELSGKPLPAQREDVAMLQLISAFIVNELRVAFQIGFMVLLPFLLIDLVVSSVLLALGLLMVPPATIALPIKVLMFILVDGWSLVLQGVVGSFR
jgi:flagellar biosynthetic protein FliP